MLETSGFDEDTTGRLNDNLDALLVFAGLFSAINTSFLLLGLTGLSSGPSDQTNHLLRLLLTNGPNSGLTSNDLDLPAFVPGRAIVRQNCFFVASLCFSLLAAAGAVLARQWLQYYERVGKTGPIREQAMRRTEKYLGAQSWGLTHVVEALPTFLILSIALFAAGLLDYLWAVDLAVAMVSLAFFVVGFLFYGFTVIAGTMTRSCPFQTSLSTFLRKLYMGTISASYWDQYVDSAKVMLADTAGTFKHRYEQRLEAEPRDRKLRHEIRDALSYVLGRGLGVVLDPFTAAGRFIRKTAVITTPNALKWTWSHVWKTPSFQGRKPRYDSDDKVYAQSVIWMAETAPDNDNMLTIAQNIPLISDFESMQLFAPTNAFKLLLLRFNSSFIALRDDPTPDRMATAVTMAKAVGHVALASPVITVDRMSEVMPKLGSLTWLLNLPSSLDSEELMIHLLSISSIFHWTKSRVSPTELTEVEAILQDGLRRSRKGKAASTYLHHCIFMAPINAKKRRDTKRQIDEIYSTLSISGVKVDVAYVSCAARALSLTIREATTLHGDAPITQPSPLEKAKSAWLIRTGNSLADTLLDVLEAFSSLYSSPPESIYSPLLLCQKQLLIHGRTLHALHSALNSNIQLLLGIQPAVFQPSIDPINFTDCQDKSIDYLNYVLLTPASQWSDVEPSELEITARWAQGLGSKSRNLSEGILYRYFVQFQQPFLRRTLADRHNAKLASDGRIGRVLNTALRLYSALCPSIDADKRWPVFQTYLRSMAIGQGMDRTPTTSPSARLRRSGARRSRSAFDTRPPPIPPLTETDSLVEKAVFEADHMWDPKDSTETGSCLIWLADSMRSREEWISQVDRGRVVQLFVTMMQKRGKVSEDAPSDTNMWSNVDVKAAGALFLRAWEAKTGPSDELLASGSDIVEKSDTSGWMADATIEAFTAWLQTFAKHGTISIMEKGDDIVFIRTTIDLELVQAYIGQANAENLPAVEQFGLNEAIERIMKGKLQPVAKEAITKIKVIGAFQHSLSPVERLRAAVAKKRPPPSSTQSQQVLPLYTSDDTAQAEGSTHMSEKDHKIGT
ncbi:hypothetical protein FRB94_004475 [Tulasnella sp. JGI-2019a]|nr:hypothetical protein FRB93_005351 [Tulasnella sp. JGI-2019a]KAG9001879.1 hypothetical protein FRB94_004475 [Tulasnella sp. JGI-2019a]